MDIRRSVCGVVVRKSDSWSAPIVGCFAILPNARDTPFIDACAAFLKPKMELSQVMPSGCNLRRVAIQQSDQAALPERPSASAFEEEQTVVDPTTVEMDLITPAFQPYHGESGRKWMAKEYGITADTSSLLSSASGTERYDTDEEVCSFDLGPEPYNPEGQGRLPSDEWMMISSRDWYLGDQNPGMWTMINI